MWKGGALWFIALKLWIDKNQFPGVINFEQGVNPATMLANLFCFIFYNYIATTIVMEFQDDYGRQ